VETYKIILLVSLFALLLLLPVAVHDLREARLYRLTREAAKIPYEDREFHRKFAKAHGYFWKPCPKCGHHFGGHETLGKTCQHPDPKLAAKGVRHHICPPCSLGLRRPSLNTTKKAIRNIRK
jgi:hypothetical protein